jgi:hypothetical protein
MNSSIGSCIGHGFSLRLSDRAQALIVNRGIIAVMLRDRSLRLSSCNRRKVTVLALIDGKLFLHESPDRVRVTLVLVELLLELLHHQVRLPTQR